MSDSSVPTRDTDCLPAFLAFASQLQKLCLDEYPCGYGSWTEPPISEDKKYDKLLRHFAVTMRDYGSQHEMAETLTALLTAKHSPWIADYSWSDEACSLREIAVKSPERINERFILSHFRTLRIVNVGVTEVDENFARFKNLHELNLSANMLKSVDSSHLPRQLKMLELSCNQVCTLTGLCNLPPPLQHIGLGYNQLCDTFQYISVEYWPDLLSLDLGHNHLSSLTQIVDCLRSLPRLRSLVLAGNPLSFVIAYRGYTIDSLPQLMFLDDVTVTADDRHNYRGFAKHSDYIRDEMRLTFKAFTLRGIPMPDGMEQPSGKGKQKHIEYPLVTHKYYVQFMFLRDPNEPGSVAVSTLPQAASQHSTLPANTCSRKSVSDKSPTQCHMDMPPSDWTESEPVMPARLPSEHNEWNITVPCREDRDAVCHPDAVGPLDVVPIGTEPTIWQDELQLNWSKAVIRLDLRPVKEFLEHGIDVRIMDEKILSYPDDEVPGRPTPSESVTSKPESPDKPKKKKVPTATLR